MAFSWFVLYVRVLYELLEDIVPVRSSCDSCTNACSCTTFRQSEGCSTRFPGNGNVAYADQSVSLMLLDEFKPKLVYEILKANKARAPGLFLTSNRLSCGD